MKTWLFPARPLVSQVPYLKLSWNPAGRFGGWDVGRAAHKGLGAQGGSRLVANLFEALDPDRMTDTGMYVWAAILTLVGLAASYAIAAGWQRWKEKKKEA